VIKLIIEREATFENNSDRQRKKIIITSIILLKIQKVARRCLETTFMSRESLNLEPVELTNTISQTPIDEKSNALADLNVN